MLDKISLITVVYNEEERLSRMLPLYRHVFAEILVIDQNSTDRTGQVVKDCGGRHHLTDRWGFCEPSKNLAWFLANNEWCLYLDADETLTTQGLDNLSNLDYKLDAYYLIRENMTGGVPEATDKRYEEKLRLFKRGMAHCEPILHTDYVPYWLGKTTRLPGISINHHKTYDEWNEDHNRYINLVNQFKDTPIVKPRIKRVYSQ